MRNHVILLGLIVVLFPGFVSAADRTGCTSNEETSLADQIVSGGDCTQETVNTFKSHVNSTGTPDISISKQKLNYGESATITVELWHDDPNVNYDCQIRTVNEGTTNSWTNFTEIVSTASSSAPQPITQSIQAPTQRVSSLETVTVTTEIYCYGPASEEDYWGWVGQGFWTRTVQYTYPTEEILDLQKEIENAASEYEQAQGKIDRAETVVENAESMGLEVNDAAVALSDAQDHLSQASNLIDSSRSSFNSQQYSEAQNKIDEAQRKLDTVISKANSAISNARSAIIDLKERAQGKINKAQMKIDTASTEINDASRSIERAKNTGITPQEAINILEDARNKRATAQSILEAAQTAINNENYGKALSKAKTSIEKAKKSIDNAERAKRLADKASPEEGSTDVNQDVENDVMSIFRSSPTIGKKQARLKANGFERSSMGVKHKEGARYSVKATYTHNSGETVTLRATVKVDGNKVLRSSLSGGNPQRIQTNWQQQQRTSKRQRYLMMAIGGALLLLIAGAFAYYFVKPVNKTVNNFVGGSGAEKGSEFSCPSCGAPVRPDDLEEGECPYCGSTVSP